MTLRGLCIGRERPRNERAIDIAIDDGGQKTAALLGLAEKGIRELVAIQRDIVGSMLSS